MKAIASVLNMLTAWQFYPIPEKLNVEFKVNEFKRMLNFELIIQGR